MTNYNPKPAFVVRVHVSQKQRLGGAAAVFPLLLLCVVTPVLGPVTFLTFPEYLGSLSWWISSPPHSPRGCLVLLQWCLLFFALPLPWQTCMGKDVTLHVSASNPAMLLYQKFGFKTEEYILDFYDKYYPLDSKECKHAFFLRLRRWAAGGLWEAGKSPIHPKNAPSFWCRMLAATGELEHAGVFIPRTLDVNSEMLYVENAIQEDWFLFSKGRGLEMLTRIHWNHWKIDIPYGEFSCHCYLGEPH